uniref:Uncharacterized protein n=1 Tax=Arundo donax TaxID=35708 RepID=A0A0A8Z0R4_ARUDO
MLCLYLICAQWFPQFRRRLVSMIIYKDSSCLILVWLGSNCSFMLNVNVYDLYYKGCPCKVTGAGCYFFVAV